MDNSKNLCVFNSAILLKSRNVFYSVERLAEQLILNVIFFHNSAHETDYILDTADNFDSNGY